MYSWDIATMRKLYSSAFAIEGNPNCQISAKMRGRGDEWGGDEQEKGLLRVGKGGGGAGKTGAMVKGQGILRKCMVCIVQESHEGRWTGNGAGGSFKEGERAGNEENEEGAEGGGSSVLEGGGQE